MLCAAAIGCSPSVVNVPMSIQVREVNSRKDLRRFIELPLRIYSRDPHYVPHLFYERRQFFSKKNPIFNYTQADYFLAYDAAGQPVGRISAHINRKHNEFHGERTGFFGFFETTPDREVARALLATAEQRLAAKGMTIIRGPFNFSTNEECGLLVDGFDTPPSIMMPHGKRYYATFLSEVGYRKAKDMFAYSYESDRTIPPYLLRAARRVRKKARVCVRAIRMEDFERDVEKAFRVYCSAWQRNWGFIPVGEGEFRHIAESLRPVIDPSVALIAEVDGEAVGFCLALPDYNVLFRRARGRLLPTGLFYMLFGRCLIDRVRVLILGVTEQHRRTGIEALLIYHLFSNGMSRGYYRGEFSWVLEDNQMMNRALERLGGVRYKTYRIYEKEL